MKAINNLKRFYWTESSEDCPKPYTPRDWITDHVSTLPDGGDLHEELKEEKDEFIHKLVLANEPDIEDG